MAEHPGVVFKDGPSGRRAALAMGPDIWEVITMVSEVEERGEEAITVSAALLDLPVGRVRVALRYYTAFRDEIDAEMAQAKEESLAAETAWRAEQQLLA